MLLHQYLPHDLLALWFPMLVQSQLIGWMFAGDAVLLVDVQHILAGSGSVSTDPGSAAVLQDSATSWPQS